MTVLPRRSFSAISFPFSSCRVKSGALSLTFMQNSPKSSKERGGATLIRPQTFARILHRGILACSVALLGIPVLSSAALAQEERPQITPGERKPQRKKDAGPRAVGVLQMSDKGKASLVPIAILINGKFWDASAYKADPVPMALDSGVVYEAEQTGSSLGLFTVNGALHSNAANSPAPWIATGTFHENDAEEPKKVQSASNIPVGIDVVDAPPRLTRSQTSNTPTSDSSPNKGNAPSSGNPPSPTSSPSSGGEKSGGSGDEPPRLNKPSSPPTSPPGGSGAPDQTQKPSDPSASSAPNDSKSKDAKNDSKPQPDSVPTSDSGASEVNRPRLRRGKPAESFADEDIPGYSKPGASPAAAPANVVQTAATQTNVKLIPAISDASGPPPHSFAFEWVKGDEEDRRKQITELAKEEVRNYVAAQQRNQISPKPARTAAANARRIKAPEPVLENLHMVAYDLWNSNQPVIIFSADAHMPPPPEGTAHSEVQSEMQYSVLLVAYPDIYNNLHKLYVGVTDKFHLDVTPKLELVDAVDADGDGRGELLFRETSDQGTGWRIYRASADKLWKMYDSLSPL